MMVLELPVEGTKTLGRRSHHRRHTNPRHHPATWRHGVGVRLSTSHFMLIRKSVADFVCVTNNATRLEQLYRARGPYGADTDDASI